MNTTDAYSRMIQFGQFRLVISPPSVGKARLLRLYCRNELIPVQPRSLDVLLALLSYPAGTMIEEQEIAERVWGKNSTVDNVEGHVWALRKALGDKPNNPKIIRTWHRRGYEMLVAHTTTSQPIVSEASGNLELDGELRSPFDEFFGLTKEDADGVIVLQSDLIDDLLKRSDPSRQFAAPISRLFKARTWVNTLDTYGAISIQQEFQNLGRKAPKLILSDHHSRDTSHKTAAFKVTLGLGFSDETTRAIQNQLCAPWMRISRTNGDAVSLHQDVLKTTASRRIKWEVDGENQGFLRLLPSDWSPDYIDDWLKMLPPTNGPEMRDYAMILRYTRLKPERQTLFVLAGFTERSTAIAGLFLAKNWKSLWTTHMRDPDYEKSLGDFFTVLEGPSDPELFESWSEVEPLRITPQILRQQAVKCEWAERMLKF